MARKLIHVKNLNERSDKCDWVEPDNEHPANCVVSVDDAGFHWPVLDIDYGVYTIPSTTPGHHHLYIDKALTESQYFELIDVCEKIGLIQPGYAKYSKERGFTSVRLPWVEKPKGAASSEFR